MDMNSIICPKCRSKLAHSRQDVVCAHCNSVFPIVDGIINFFPEVDKFYEGKFGTDRTRSVLSKKRYAAFKAYLTVSAYGLRAQHMKHYQKLKNESRVLDIGCGSGDPYLSRKGFFVVGIDMSLSSLINAREIYDEVFKVAAPPLPFPDGNFDCVCSFDLIGHIPRNQKDALLKEMHRVLKPEGLSFHYVEVDGKRGLNNWAKKCPTLYRKYFVDQDGHYGLEDYADVLKRFEKNGFCLLERKMLAKIMIPPIELSKRLNNEYKETNMGVNIVAKFASLVSSNMWITAFLGIMLKPLQIIYESLISDDYGGLLFVIYKKAH